MKMSKKIRAIRAIVKNYFKDKDGRPFQITDGECLMFEAVVNQRYKWVLVTAPTRYGKSELIAIAVIYLAVFHNLKIPVVAGSADKADKVMEYVVQHLSDHPELYAGLLNIEIGKIERLKLIMAKQALRWHTGGWIYITSIDSRSIMREGEGVIGEGGDVVVLEEAGLIKHKEQFSKIVRMPESNRGWGKLVMSGNCVEKSVFETAWNEPKYHKVRISLEQAFSEGRLDRDRIMNDVKPQMTTRDWLRFYECRFPTSADYSYFQPRNYEVLPPPEQMFFYGAIDPSLGEKKDRGDKQSLSAIVVLGVDRVTKQIYEVYSEGEIIKPNEAINRILNLPYRFVRFVVEAVQFQNYFKQVLEDESRLHQKYIPFSGIRQSRAKIERIESLEPYINTGQILFKGKNELEKELRDYPASDHLDVLDALEMALRTALSGAGTLPTGQAENTKQGVGVDWRSQQF